TCPCVLRSFSEGQGETLVSPTLEVRCELAIKTRDKDVHKHDEEYAYASEHDRDGADRTKEGRDKVQIHHVTSFFASSVSPPRPTNRSIAFIASPPRRAPAPPTTRGRELRRGRGRRPPRGTRASSKPRSSARRPCTCDTRRP